MAVIVHALFRIKQAGQLGSIAAEVLKKDTLL